MIFFKVVEIFHAETMESGRGHYLAIRAALSPKVFLRSSVRHTFAHKRFSVYQIREAAHIVNLRWRGRWLLCRRGAVATRFISPQTVGWLRCARSSCLGCSAFGIGWLWFPCVKSHRGFFPWETGPPWVLADVEFMVILSRLS